MPAEVVKRFSRRKDSLSTESAVEAASIMMIGASIKREIGKTIVPKALSWISSSGKRAIAALTSDISIPINNQLAARGHQAVKILRSVRGVSSVLLMGCGVVTQREARMLRDPQKLGP